MTAPADESLQQLLVLAIDVVEEAARTADRRPEALEIGTKANRNDLVTQVDRAIEDAVARRLLDETGLPLLGEEGHAIDSYSGRVWVLDPIDGTMNYVETRRDYAVSLALCEDGEPVLGVVADVARGDLYSAVRGGGAFLNDEPLPVVEADKGYRDGIIVTDLKEILALPRLARCLEESRGHRRYGSAALECVEIAAGRAGPSSTCGSLPGTSRRPPSSAGSAVRGSPGSTARLSMHVTRARSSSARRSLTRSCSPAW